AWSWPSQSSLESRCPAPPLPSRRFDAREGDRRPSWDLLAREDRGGHRRGQPLSEGAEPRLLDLHRDPWWPAKVVVSVRGDVVNHPASSKLERKSAHLGAEVPDERACGDRCENPRANERLKHSRIVVERLTALRVGEQDAMAT